MTSGWLFKKTGNFDGQQYGINFTDRDAEIILVGGRCLEACLLLVCGFFLCGTGVLANGNNSLLTGY